MRIILITLLTLITFTSLLAQKDKRLKGLEVDLNKILEASKTPGFAIAIVEGKEIVYAEGFGYSDYENKIPADANTIYPIASSTKAFTAALLGQLQEEEKISFDESPIKYIPDLKFYNDKLNNDVVIKDLICHSTGIPRHDASWYLFPSKNRDSMMHRIQYHEPYKELREQWYYNNFMYLTQGVLAERITGQSWEDNIKERFFEPLNMKRSSVTIDELAQHSNVALGYELQGDSLINKVDYFHFEGLGPAGGINSSVNDLSNWLISWINKGKHVPRSTL